MKPCKYCKKEETPRGGKCKSCKYEFTRVWKSENRNKVNASDKKWRSKNKDKYNESQRRTYHKYIEKNRKYGRELYHKLSKRYGFSLNTISRNGGLERVKEVYEKYNHQCGSCGSSEDLNIHHIDNQGRSNLRKGLKPNNSISNLEILCRRCHTIQHNKEKIYA